MKLTATQFQVLNYRNIDDSGWIPLERVTAFVGRNEAGKTALLKALHKFYPAIEEPYNAQREFPRDRFTAEYRDGGDWPVCRVEFELSADFRKELGERLNGAGIPQRAILTRYYDGSLEYDYDMEVSDDPVDPAELVTALDTFAKGARRLAAPAEDQEEATQALRTKLADWADGKKEVAGKLQDLRKEKGVELLGQVRQESNAHAQPTSADLVEVLQGAVDELRGKRRKPRRFPSSSTRPSRPSCPSSSISRITEFSTAPCICCGSLKTLRRDRKNRVFGRSTRCSSMCNSQRRKSRIWAGRRPRKRRLRRSR